MRKSHPKFEVRKPCLFTFQHESWAKFDASKLQPAQRAFCDHGALLASAIGVELAEKFESDVSVVNSFCKSFCSGDASLYASSRFSTVKEHCQRAPLAVSLVLIENDCKQQL